MIIHIKGFTKELILSSKCRSRGNIRFSICSSNVFGQSLEKVDLNSIILNLFIMLLILLMAGILSQNNNKSHIDNICFIYALDVCSHLDNNARRHFDNLYKSFKFWYKQNFD